MQSFKWVWVGNLKISQTHGFIIPSSKSQREEVSKGNIHDLNWESLFRVQKTFLLCGTNQPAFGLSTEGGISQKTLYSTSSSELIWNSIWSQCSSSGEKHSPGWARLDKIIRGKTHFLSHTQYMIFSFCSKDFCKHFHHDFYLPRSRRC